MPSSFPHLLLVEGKGALADSVINLLTKKWHDIAVVYTGNEALTAAQERPPQVIIFDASSMRSNGLRNCQRLRKHLPDVPLIYIQAAGASFVENTQADIYLKKPFTARKLINRVTRLLPPEDTEDQIMKLGCLTLYQGKGAVEIEGRGEYPMTPKLVDLLAFFMSHPEEILSRKQLMEAVWDTSYVGDTRTLDVHIRWMRQIIEEDPRHPELLTTVRGIGYMLQIEAPFTGNGSSY